MHGPMQISWLQGGKKFRYDTHMATPIAAGSPEGSLARTMTVHSWSLYDGTYFYTVTSSKRVSRQWVAPEFAGRVASKPYELVGAIPNARKLVGRGVVLGKPCEIRQTSARHIISNGGSIRYYARVWMWRGLPLRIESSIQTSPGSATTRRPRNADMRGSTIKTSMVATGVDISSKPSPALFKVPAGSMIQDVVQPTGKWR